jgi:2-succinyl-6-hydroxy-2,4-cyclohexadiene-1-carboxylate synthase
VVRVVLVHGFTQTGRSWRTIADALRADGYEVSTPDLPGHAGSAPKSLTDAAAIVAAAQGPAIYVGYSMGGRVCLRLALDHPDIALGLVLLSATAGIADPAAREARRKADTALAERVFDIGVSAFVHEWLKQPMFARLPIDSRDRNDRLRNTVDGLAGALRLAGAGAQEPLWDRLRELRTRRVPVLVLAGDRDTKFVELAETLANGIGPTAERSLIADAGHAAHLEQPAAFLQRLRAWLATQAQPAGS